MSVGMDRYFKHLTRKEVNAGHWALLEAAEEVNNIVVAWLSEQKITPPEKL